MIEFNSEHLLDSALASNTLPFFTIIEGCLRRHPEIDVKDKKRLIKHLKKLRAAANTVCFKTNFKEL